MAVASDLVKEVRIKATPETIFPFFTDPQKMMQWKGSEVELDPVPGGKYWVKMSDTHSTLGEYITIEPHTRLLFTWGWEQGDATVGPGATTIEITLTPDGDETLVRLTHMGLPSEESKTNHAFGWDHYLARLVIAAAGGDAGVDELQMK